MANDTIIGEIYRNVMRHSVSAMNVSDSESFPIVRSLFGTLTFQITKKLMSENSGPYWQFYEFLSFAFPMLHQSFSSSLLDLIVLFHTQGKTGLSWIEFVDETDGVHESPTALLEAKYGWQGVIVLKRTKADWVRQNRRADTYNQDEFESNNEQDILTASPIGSNSERGESRRQSHRLDNEMSGLSSFLESRYGSLDFAFIYVGNCEQFFQLRESSFFDDARATVLIVSYWDDERSAQVFSYLQSLGYVSWLPEFVVGHFVFITDAALLPSTSPIVVAPMVRNSIPQIADFSSRLQNARKERTEPCKLELVGVHFPKTGGASLLLGLNEHYGDWLYEDYASDPSNPLTYKRRPPVVGSYTKAVYGHFRADRYQHYNPRFLFTFIRDPFDLLLSNYFFLRDNVGETTNPEVTLFQKQRPTLREYAANSGLAYAAYFGNVDLDSFDFVGRYANYAEDLERLGQMIGVRFPQSGRNRFAKTQERLDMETDTALKAYVIDCLRGDYDIYEEMLKKAQ